MKLIINIINESKINLIDVREDIYKGTRISKKVVRREARYHYQSVEGSDLINIRLYYRPDQFDIPDAVFYAHVDTSAGWRIGGVGNELIEFIIDRSKLASSSCITLTLKNKDPQ